MKQTVV